MKNIIRLADALTALVLTVVFTLVITGDFLMPDSLVVRTPQDREIGKIYSVSAKTEASVDYQSAQSVGTDQAEYRLFGIIPVKSTQIINGSVQKVLVSGQSFGIKLYTNGVIVVGVKDIHVNGKTVNPSREAGIAVGDIIVAINGAAVYSSAEVEQILNDNSGEDYLIKVKRNGKYKTFRLKPVYVESDDAFKAGMWVRDSTAGIGTITFFDPASGSVAALGHPITDVDTGEIMPILNGEAVETRVSSVIKSSSSETGSLCCDFLSGSIGSLDENTERGVYGEYTQSTDLSQCCEYEVASPQEVERGFAQIICTVDENGPQVYSAEITKISYTDDVKNMIIRITDEKLIEKTGGIVQGMSGTPIIQNGKLIGAITHVIVNNPLKGYAIFSQTMLEETQN